VAIGAVGVQVDQARKNVLACRIDNAVGRHCQRRANRRDRFAVYEDISGVPIGGRDDGASFDQERHADCSIVERRLRVGI